LSDGVTGWFDGYAKILQFATAARLHV
jgi:hypothetical protein